MKTEKKQKARLGVFVRLDDNSQSFDSKATTWIRAIPVVITEKSGELGFQYCSMSTETETLENLQLTALLMSDIAADQQTLGIGDLRASNIYSAYAYELEAIAKAMKAIKSRMDKLNEQFGRTLSYGQELLRFVSALNADTIITEWPADSRQQANGRRWHFHDQLDYGMRSVDKLISDWNEKHSPAHKPVVTANDNG